MNWRVATGRAVPPEGRRSSARGSSSDACLHRQAGGSNGMVPGLLEVEDEDGSKSKVNIYNGRKITGAGQKLLDNAAHGIRESVDANYPGMEKY